LGTPNLFCVYYDHNDPSLTTETFDINTGKPILRGHLWDKEKVVLLNR
jgi:hypothetical protein